MIHVVVAVVAAVAVAVALVIVVEDSIVHYVLMMHI
jgi:hypothetical protein